MSLITLAIANGILVVAVVTALASVCRIPFRLERFARPQELLADERKPPAPAYERYAA